MIISVQGALDLGFSLGIDDHAFAEEEQLSRLRTALDLPIWRNERAEGTNVSTPEQTKVPLEILRQDIGFGLRIGIRSSDFLRSWWNDARLAAANTIARAYEGDPPDFAQFPYHRVPRPDAERLVTQAFENSDVALAYIDVFAIGIPFVRIDIDYRGPIDYMIDFAREFEDSCHYRKTAPTFWRKLAGAFRRVYLDEQKQRLLGDRADLEKMSDDTVGPAFMFIVMCEREAPDRDEVIAAVQAYEGGSDVHKLDLDEGELHLGYASAIFVHDRDDPEEILYPLEFAQVCWQILSSFEGFFSQQTMIAVRKTMTGSSLLIAPHELNQLTIMASAVIQMTRLRANTVYSVYWKLYDAFEALNNTAEKVDSINRASEMFNTIGREAIAAYKENQSRAQQARESEREQRMSLFLMVLTAITTIGVAAEALNAVDYDYFYAPAHWQRAQWILLLSLVALLLAWQVTVLLRASARRRNS